MHSGLLSVCGEITPGVVAESVWLRAHAFATEGRELDYRASQYKDLQI